MRSRVLLTAILSPIAAIAAPASAMAQAAQADGAVLCEAQIACEQGLGCSTIRAVPITFHLTPMTFEQTGQAGYLLAGLGGDRIEALAYDTLDDARVAAAAGQMPAALDAIMVPWAHMMPDFQKWQIHEVTRALRLSGFEYRILDERVTKFTCTPTAR